MQVADTEREVIDPFKHLMKNHDDNMQSASAASGEKKVRRRFKISHVEDLSAMIARVWSDELSLQLESTNEFRKILSSNMAHPIENVVGSGAEPRFVEFLGKEVIPKFQNEAAWVLSNIASEKLEIVTYHSPVPILDNILDSPNDDVPEQHLMSSKLVKPALAALEQVLPRDDEEPLNLVPRHPSPVVIVPALRTIRNIVSVDNQQTQSAIDAYLIPVLVNLAQNAELDLKIKAVRATSNAIAGGSNDLIKYLVEQSCIKPLCDLQTCPCLRTISVCLYGLENILMVREAQKNTGEVNCYSQLIKDAKGLAKLEPALHSNDEKVLSDASFALWHLSYGSENGIQSVIEAGVVPRVVQFLIHTSSVVIVHQLRTLGNVRPGYHRPAQDVGDSDDTDHSDSDLGSGGSGSASGSSGGSAGSGSGGSGSGGSGSDESVDLDDLDCTGACVVLQWKTATSFVAGRREGPLNLNSQETVIYPNIARDILHEFCSGWNFGNSPPLIEASTDFPVVLHYMKLAGKKAGRLLEDLFDNDTPREMSELEHLELKFAWSLAGYYAGRFMMQKYMYRKVLNMTTFGEFFTGERF